jgi:hypothetical protein
VNHKRHARLRAHQAWRRFWKKYGDRVAIINGAWVKR